MTQGELYERWGRIFKNDPESKWITTHTQWERGTLRLVEDLEGRGVIAVSTREACLDSYMTVPDHLIASHHIYYVYTLPEHRGKGVMRGLLRMVLAAHRHVSLETWSCFIPWWEKMGFEHIGWSPDLAVMEINANL